MFSFQATAIRVCGVAVLVMIAAAMVSAIEFAQGASVGPSLQMSTSIALCVAIAGFWLANVRSQKAAESVSLSAAVVIAVLVGVYVYKLLATPVLANFTMRESLTVADAAIVMGLLGGVVLMCRSVWLARRPSAA